MPDSQTLETHLDRLHMAVPRSERWFGKGGIVVGQIDCIVVVVVLVGAVAAGAGNGALTGYYASALLAVNSAASMR